MPRPLKQTLGATPTNTLVLDNGAYTIKAGFAGVSTETNNECHIIPNCIGRTRKGKVCVADQLNDLAPEDTAEILFRRPMDKGYIVSWDGQFDVWKQAFFQKGSKLLVDPSETNIILTEAPNCLPVLQANCDQVLFEELDFAAAYRCLGPILVAHNSIASLTGDPEPYSHPAECVLVIDSGYSHTTVTPLLYGRPVHAAIRRLDIGGKLLTNYLMEVVSNRYLDLREDPNIVSQMKEDACYVTQDFRTDLERVWKSGKQNLPPPRQDSILKDYVLPDYITAFRGYLRPHDFSPKTTTVNPNTTKTQKEEDFCPPGAERFAVPELLFTPSDVGIAQSGLPEVVIQSLECLPPGVWPAMLANIIVVGGNAKIPGFVERLEAELRALTPSECTLRVCKPINPITYTWLGGCQLANNTPVLNTVMVTREEYQEHGQGWTARRFIKGFR